MNKIDKILEGITPAPWNAEGWMVYGYGGLSSICDTHKQDNTWRSEKSGTGLIANAAFIAAAPTMLRELNEHAMAMREALANANECMMIEQSNGADIAQARKALEAFDNWNKGE